MDSTSTIIQQIAESQNIYWLFSSSAQAISAFVAFLLTGFALVHTMMDSLQQKDDTLEEIHSKLMRIYYRRIKWLASLTGLAIILSLMMVYLNGISVPYNSFLVVFTSCVNVAAIIGGILFVISIINPDKYKKAALDIIKEEKTALEPTGTPIQEVDFIRQFIQLEILIRDVLRKRDLYIPSRTGPRMSFSVRQMVEALYHNELIDQQLFNELMEVNKYRNLVIHGHKTDVDKGMLDKVNNLITKIKKVK